MLDTVLLVTAFVRGTAQHSVRDVADRSRPDMGEATVRAIAEYGQECRYPTLVATMASASSRARDRDEPSGFEFGLQRILDGLDRHLRG
jgi:hypothetical protein